MLAVATVAAVVMAVTKVLTISSSSSMMETPSVAAWVVASSNSTVASTTVGGRQAIFAWSAVPFLVAFMGWMPGGLELSVWQSLWVQADSEERIAAGGQSTSMAAASLDFNVGYVLTVVLACLFLILGTLTLPEQGLSAEPAAFAGQLVGMYTQYIGAWAEPVIGLCAIAAIFSTTFTVVDAFPRTLEAALYELWPTAQSSHFPIKQALTLSLILLAALLLSLFTAGFEPLINTITIIAFTCAPFYAWLNMRSIRTLAEERQPAPWLARLATVGLLYLSGFSILFLALQLAGQT
ncbi:MAG: hypothetical protein HC800_01830 [Phormidesmis sp. RL_2_1]|nr:hypothetical protein [Phormidesmis sp. RL_2_1]